VKRFDIISSFLSYFIIIIFIGVIENKYNFQKHTASTINSLGSPYDYDSIMHYEWNAFSKSKKPHQCAGRIPNQQVLQIRMR